MNNQRFLFKPLSVSVGLFVTLFLPHFVLAQDCGLITRGGIYDYSSTQYDKRQLDSFVDWFRSQTFTSYENAKERSGSVGVVIKGIPGNAQYADSESGFGQLKQDIDSYRAGNKDLREKLTSFLRTINTRVNDNLTRCLLQAGLHAWLETTEDPKIFRLVLKFTSSSDKVSFAEIEGNPDVTGARCSNAIRDKTRIKGSVKRARCTRFNSEAPVTITLNASETIIGEASLTLPAIPPLQPLYAGFSSTVLPADSSVSGGNYCERPIIPANIAVRVSLGGSWNIFNAAGNVETGVSVAHRIHVSRIHAYDTVARQHLGAQDFWDAVTVTSIHPFQVCVDPPVPPAGGRIKVNSDDPIKIRVVDARTASP